MYKLNGGVYGYMIILEFKGGLGNQMFQYAFYKSLLYYKRDVKCKVTNEKEYRPFKLNVFPRIELEYADDAEYEKRLLQYINRKFVNKIINKMFSNSRKFYYHENEKRIFDKKLYKFDDIILSGYFQNEAYFKMIKKQIKDDFLFPYGEEKLQNFVAALSEKSVSIHIRRGDYLDYPQLYGNICTLNYYHRAIEYINNRTKADYIVFSNDIEWAKKNLNLSKVTYVEKKMFDKYDDWYDIYIMSKCHHNIIANSSFSWWGGWLNEHSDKIVVAPPYLDNRYKYKRLACDDWVVIKG